MRERPRLQTSGLGGGACGQQVSPVLSSWEVGLSVLKPGTQTGPPSQPQPCPYLMTWLCDLEQEEHLQLLRPPEMGPGEGETQPVIIG